MSETRSHDGQANSTTVTIDGDIVELSAPPRELQRSYDRVVARIEAVNEAEDALDGMRPFPHTIHVDGVSVALHQRVLEVVEDPFGGEERIEWVVTDLTDGTVFMMNSGGWDRTKELEYDEFADAVDRGDLSPSWITDDQPRWGY